MSNFDVYISYAEEDKAWVTTELVEEIEDNHLSVCLRSRDFNDELSLQENRKVLVEQCSSCVLVFSKHYCKKASEWSYFTKFINNKTDKDSNISVILDNKGIVCIYLSQCTVPSLFSKQKMLDWSAVDLRHLFWHRLIKFLKNAQKKSQIKKTLMSKIKSPVSKTESESSITTPASEMPSDTVELKSAGVKIKSEIALTAVFCEAPNTIVGLKTESDNSKATFFAGQTSGEIVSSNSEGGIEYHQPLTSSTVKQGTDSTDELSENENENEDEVNGKVTDYILFNNVYPHLVSSSFNAEDDDLTREDIENMTLKMEDVETIMLLNEKPTENNNTTVNNDSTVTTQSKFHQFESQHEQMQVLDALQTVQERIQRKLDTLAVGLPRVCDGHLAAVIASKKKRYRRLLQRYQECLMQAVNGRKHRELVDDSLPFVSDLLNDNIDLHGFRCNCCDGLYHSKRALDLHMGFCVRQHWIDLKRHVLKSHQKK